MVRELIGDQNKQDDKAFLKLYPVCVCLLWGTHTLTPPCIY